MIARIGRDAPWLWGVVVALFLCRFFFLFGPGEFYVSHESWMYPCRVTEFLADLRAGYLFPQWAVDFRGGLGSPYFGYYQPGFFYAAAPFAALLPVVRALGATLLVFSFLGYAGLFSLVRGRFGTAAGVLAGTVLLGSDYTVVEIYTRGDYSEYAGMMALAPTLALLVGWLEHGGTRRWLGVALGCAAIVLLHPAAGLIGYGTFALVTLVYAPAAGRRRAAWVVVALVAGGGLAAFFWLPVALEWRLVVGDRMIQMGYAFTRQFILPRQILGYPGTKIVPGASLGEVVPRLLAVATGLALAGWRRMTAARWRLVAALWLVAAVGVFMSGAASTPVWNVLPLLYRIQFPWRFLVVIVVATAGLAGCVPMLSTPLAVVGVAMLAWSWAWAAPMRTTDFPLPETGAEIVRLSCRPDIADEWMPRGAKAFYGKRRPPPTEATCAPDCRVDSLERAPGALRARVETNRLALVTLPHYYFPVGWTATLDGVPTPIQPTRDGLMTAIVAHGGVLELRWATTPGRRWGVLVSALTLACLAAMVWCRLPA